MGIFTAVLAALARELLATWTDTVVEPCAGVPYITKILGQGVVRVTRSGLSTDVVKHKAVNGRAAGTGTGTAAI